MALLAVLRLKTEIDLVWLLQLKDFGLSHINDVWSTTTTGKMHHRPLSLLIFSKSSALEGGFNICENILILCFLYPSFYTQAELQRAKYSNVLRVSSNPKDPFHELLHTVDLIFLKIYWCCDAVCAPTVHHTSPYKDLEWITPNNF